MASPTPWTWVWASSRRWWRAEKPGMGQSMRSQKSDTTERLNWTMMYPCLLRYFFNSFYILTVQCSHSVMSDCLWPHELQHARPPCPSPTPGVHTNSCPWSWWCHPTISSSVVPFSSCLQSFPASGSFPMSQPKYRSFSFSTSPSSEYSGLISFRIYWFDLTFC